MKLFAKHNYHFFFLILFVVCIVACKSKSSSAELEDTKTEQDSVKDVSAPVPSFEITEYNSAPSYNDPNEGSSEKGALKELEEYIVKLAVDSSFNLQDKGELRVWIGADEQSFIVEKNMAEDKSTIPSNIGQYAKVTPYSPNFEVSPVETKCMKLDPSGSEVRFTLIPQEAGEFTVSANVELFTNADCSGTSIPKITKTLKVKVSIDNEYLVKSKVSELLTVVWDKFLSFWGALVTFLLGALFFVIRRKVKNTTGYEENKDNT